MSISNSAEIQLQPFQHPPVGGKPRGLFGASKTTTGDASGGDIFTEFKKSSGIPGDLIYQIDTVIVSSESNTLNIFEVEIFEGGIYDENVVVRGSMFDDVNEPLAQYKGYIIYPTKGQTTFLKFQTDNDDLIPVQVAVRGRYWERSYLRERGETPLFL